MFVLTSAIKGDPLFCFPGMTPHFTMRVWGETPMARRFAELYGVRPRRELLCDIEVDTTVPGTLSLVGHRGCELIPQKMLMP